MPRIAVLLRGVNVGRGNRVPMADFRAILESLQFTDVATLLNSGNAVATARSGTSAKWAAQIRAALFQRLAVDVPVIVKTEKDLAAIEKENALAKVAKDPSRLLIAFTPDATALKALADLEPLVRRDERFLLGKSAAYLWCPAGILQSKAGEALLGRRKQPVTTRNWATVTKIIELVRAPSQPSAKNAPTSRRKSK